MDYRTFEPHADLEAIVKCFWTLEAPKELMPGKQRIVPDGCMEMIFHYGDLYKQYAESGTFIAQPKCFVFGQITSPLDIEPAGITGIFAVRFYPGSFAPFAAIPVQGMENRAVALTEVFGEEGLLLENEVLNARTTAGRIAATEAFLLKKLSSPVSVDRIARSTVEMIMQLKGQVSVDELSEQLQVNRRQLERRFSLATGLGPKQLSKMIRLQAALKKLLGNQSASLTAVAYESDYYDQAHFIKDFKEFTGMSPKMFYADNLKMSALFSGTE